MEGKLYGIGVGPGNPEQLTLEAKRILEEVDIIYTPCSKPGKSSLALEIIAEVVEVEGRVEDLHFPMTNNQAKLKKAWAKARREIVSYLQEGKTAAFITLGDPLLYSTYIYLLEEIEEHQPQLEVETIPGVTAITGCSARLNLPLGKKEEKVAILPVGEVAEIEDVVLEFETTVLLKVSHGFEQIRELLSKVGLKEDAYFISRCGQPEEQIKTDLDSIKAEEVDYLSLIIVKK